MATIRVWLDPKEHTVEGHTKQCILYYDGRKVWGPMSCHDNTSKLRDALHKADPKFDMDLLEKPKTIEGHTVSISVSVGDTVYLDKLSTHENMQGLCKAIFDAQQGHNSSK